MIVPSDRVVKSKQMVTRQTYNYMQNLLDHKRLVGLYLQRVTTALFRRAVVHDYSKFAPDEFGPYAAALPRFEKSEYGSDEYKACCESIKPAIEHHFRENRHHPEHFPNGVNDMNLLDVVEMVCDWMAASQRVPGNTLRLDLQKERFGIDDQLFGLISRTVACLMSDAEGEQHD